MDLALNANNTTYGSGGENIRDLQDTLADMSSGIVAHTGTYPTDVGAQTWTGYHTTTGPTTVTGTAGVWSGYDDTLNSATYKLGPRSLSEKRPEPAYIMPKVVRVGDSLSTGHGCTGTTTTR